LIQCNVQGADGGYILKDWRGNLYSVGTQVVYPRSVYAGTVEIAHGTVTDIYRVTRDEDFKWVRIDPVSAYADWEWRVSIRTTGSSNLGEDCKEVTIKNIKNITVIGSPTAAARPFSGYGCVISE
jgi:hypothetical protein